MPLYVYVCGKCRHEFELFLEGPAEKAVCPRCQFPEATRKSYFQACSWTSPEDSNKGT